MIVLRHSDSCTQDADLRDHDRPLTSWGRTAAAKLCSELTARGLAAHICTLNQQGTMATLQAAGYRPLKHRVGGPALSPASSVGEPIAA